MTSKHAQCVIQFEIIMFGAWAKLIKSSTSEINTFFRLHVLREGGVGGQCIIIICATTRREVCENVGLHHLMGILEKVQGLILLLPFLAIFYPRGPNFEIRENHPLQTPNPLF